MDIVLFMLIGNFQHIVLGFRVLNTKAANRTTGYLARLIHMHTHTIHTERIALLSQVIFHTHTPQPERTTVQKKRRVRIGQINKGTVAKLSEWVSF